MFNLCDLTLGSGDLDFMKRRFINEIAIEMYRDKEYIWASRVTIDYGIRVTHLQNTIFLVGA